MNPRGPKAARMKHGGMHMKKLTCLLLALCLAGLASAGALASSGQKDVWIDNTVDNSVAIVIGQLSLTDAATGEATVTELYRKQTPTTYASEPRITQKVQELADEARDALNAYAAEKGYAVPADPFTVTSDKGKVWDHRKYETVMDEDATLIGDTDYFGDLNGGGNSATRTHIASGDYGIEHIFTVTLNAETGGLTLISDVSLTVAPPAVGQKRLSSNPAVTVPSGKGYKLRSAGWLEADGGMASVATDYTFEAGKTYYRSILLEAEDGYAFKSGAAATGNYETQYHLAGECSVAGGDLYIAAVRGDYHYGALLTVVVKVQPEQGKRLPGDVTDDGVVDGRDVLRLMKYFAGQNVELK